MEVREGTQKGPPYLPSWSQLTLDKLPVSHRAGAQRQTTIHSHIHTYGLFRVPDNLPSSSSCALPCCCEVKERTSALHCKTSQLPSFNTLSLCMYSSETSLGLSNRCRFSSVTSLGWS